MREPQHIYVSFPVVKTKPFKRHRPWFSLFFFRFSQEILDYKIELHPVTLKPFHLHKLLPHGNYFQSRSIPRATRVMTDCEDSEYDYV